MYLFVLYLFIYYTTLSLPLQRTVLKVQREQRTLHYEKGQESRTPVALFYTRLAPRLTSGSQRKKKTLSSKIFVFIFYEHFCKITKGQNRKLQQTNSWKEGTDGFEHEESYTSAIMVKTDILLPYFVWFINEFRRTQTEDNCVLTISFLILSNANCKAIRHKWLQWFMSRLKRDWLTVSCSFCWEPVSMFLCSMGFIFGIIFGLVFDLTLKGRGSY